MLSAQSIFLEVACSISFFVVRELRVFNGPIWQMETPAEYMFAVSKKLSLKFVAFFENFAGVVCFDDCGSRLELVLSPRFWDWAREG